MFAGIPLGEQLETVHIERQRAQAAYHLIDYYNQFSRDDTSRLDALKKEGRDGRQQVAIVLRRLNTVAKEVDLPAADKVFTLLSLLKLSFTLTIDTRKH
jgi:exocyst complex component 5